MFINISKLIFIFILILGSIISISSNYWLGAWVGIEINLISFIPLIINKIRLNNSEGALNYFLVQALGSSIILFSINFYYIFLLINLTAINNNKINVFMIFIILSLILKLGGRPFHFWICNVRENISWKGNLILLIWQKLIPLTLINYLIINNLIIIPLILFNLFIGSFGGLNQTSLRKILVFSSINHIGWILSSLIIGSLIWITYFILYSVLNFCVVFLFNFYQIYYLRQINFLLINKFNKLYFIIRILSLGGLPPFLGFYPKWIVIQLLTADNSNFLLINLVFTRIITLKFYLNICVNSFIINSFTLNWTNINLNSLYKMNSIKIFVLLISVYGFLSLTLINFLNL